MKTPLYDLHIELGARMVEFAGWHMPVSYPAGKLAEHQSAREKAALFDVSHMGQVELHGDLAAGELELLVPSAATNLTVGKARYTVFTNDTGGILDDLIVSNSGDHLYLVVNASRAEADIALRRAKFVGVGLVVRNDLALLALQGPKAAKVLGELVPDALTLKFMETRACKFEHVDIRVSPLGYTGEDGFEISCPAGAAEDIARRFLAHDDVSPGGLGARDTLRL